MYIEKAVVAVLAGAILVLIAGCQKSILSHKLVATGGEHSVALYAMHYNFCRIHRTLRVTPAMEAGIADHVWDLEELIGLLDSVPS